MFWANKDCIHVYLSKGFSQWIYLRRSNTFRENRGVDEGGVNFGGCPLLL